MIKRKYGINLIFSFHYHMPNIYIYVYFIFFKVLFPNPIDSNIHVMDKLVFCNLPILSIELDSVPAPHSNHKDFINSYPALALQIGHSSFSISHWRQHAWQAKCPQVADTSGLIQGYAYASQPACQPHRGIWRKALGVDAPGQIGSESCWYVDR